MMKVPGTTVLVIALLACAPARAVFRPAERTAAPYFKVKGPLERFPLEHTRVAVDAAGTIASMVVEQTYRNRGTQPIEAVYVFPAGTRAAVHGMKMTIGDRVRRAQIMKKSEAKQGYEVARSAGKGAALLEQERPNVFQMSVANVMPGEAVKVELEYTELLVPEKGTYEFVFPTVVAPRYTGTQAEFPAAPYLKEGTPSPAGFSFDMTVAPGSPIRSIASPTHQFSFAREDARAVCTLAEPGPGAADRDVIVQWSLGGDGVASGLVMSPGADGGYFVLTVQPPRLEALRALPAREYVFVVDVSGSMSGFPLDTARGLLAELLADLGPRDRFNILTFAGDSRVLAGESMAATPENKTAGRAFLDAQHAGGGTELTPALRRALAMPRGERESCTIVVITDGEISTEAGTFALVRASAGAANVFTFGIGSSVNRFLIEGLARAGRGQPFVVTDPAHAAGTARRFRELIASPVLTSVRVDATGLAVFACEPPLAGGLPDLFCERPVTLFGKWKGPRAGRFHVRGHGPSGVFEATLDVANAVTARSAASLKQLWARHQIEALTDQASLTPTDDLARQITALGLEHHLLTEHTSFLAVDELVRAPGQPLSSVTQPLVLPRGVSELAVGQTIPAAPEPDTWTMVVLLLGIAAWSSRPRAQGRP